MWRTIAKYFNRFPKRRILAQKLLEYGLRVTNNNIYCGEIELSDSKISRAFKIDRRIISSTIETIMKEEELKKVFSRGTCRASPKESARIITLNLSSGRVWLSRWASSLKPRVLILTSVWYSL